MYQLHQSPKPTKMFGLTFTFPEIFSTVSSDQEVPEFDDVNFEAVAHAQQKIEHDLDHYHAFKSYKRVVFYLSAMFWTMMLCGYETQAGGMVLSIPQFREDFGYAYEGSYVLSAKWQSAITAGPTASMAISYLIGSWLSDMYGRRRLLVLSTLFGIPWITMEYVSTTIEVFFVGKFLNALVLGSLAAVCSTYVSEISPMALRGVASASLNLAGCIGPFICVLINNTTATYTTRMAYRGIFIPQWVFAISALALQCFLPESPYWLLSKGRNKDAVIQLKRMFDDDDTVRAQYSLMKITVEEAASVSAASGTYIDCFRKKDIKRTFIIWFTFIMQAFSGVAYVAGYSTYYFQLAGFSTQKSFQISCGAQALSISGTLTSLFVVDKFGRRGVTLFGMISLTIINLIVAAAGIDTTDKAAVSTSAAFMAMYNYFFNVAIGPIPYVVANEASSIFLRAKTFSLGCFWNSAFQCMWASVIPYMFNPDQGNMGSKINFIFSGCSLFSVFVFYFYMPETAHRSFEEIDEMFAVGVPARHWKSYKTEKQARSEVAFEEKLGSKEEEFIENIAESAVSSDLK